jgi:hypothetical protein
LDGQLSKRNRSIRVFVGRVEIMSNSALVHGAANPPGLDVGL